MDLLGIGLNAAFMQKKLYRMEEGKRVAIEGSSVWTAGALRGRPMMGLKHAYHNAIRGQIAMGMLGAAVAAGTAPRHHAVSSVAKSLVPTVASAVGFALGGGWGALVAGAIGDIASDTVVGRGVQALNDLGQRRGRINMGGDYEDTQAAYTMRQMAAQSMSGSMLNARRYLGQEAAFLHT